MKIKQISINSYKHLENLHLDFTYPEGHEKAGQPLDKICLIGQSATGKTNILELLKKDIAGLRVLETIDGKSLMQYHRSGIDVNIQYLYENELLITEKNKVTKGNVEFNISRSGGSVGNLIPKGLKILFFSSETISRKTIVGVFNQNPLDILNTFPKDNRPEELRHYYANNYDYEFSEETDLKIWISLLHEILDYRKKFTQMIAELMSKGTIGDVNRLNNEYGKWSAKNENPILKFAEYFNPILNKLELEVDTVNTEYAIPIRSKIQDHVVPISDLSTGTKGLLLSLFPLFQLNTTDAIILMDEPERSLFPDIQIELISSYQRLAPSAQLVVATHSPFIAAAFEPEERFILYFDKEGKVAVRRGESPIGDDPNDILRNDFNVDLYNEFGKKAYKTYLDLKNRLKQESEPEKKKELLLELTQLGDKYNF